MDIVDSSGHNDVGTDVVFPMRLFDDTAGGVWGFSGSSWLHVDNAGELVARFDTDILDSPWILTGADAVTPTQIVVSAVWSDGELFGDILLFDTTTKERKVLLHQDHPVGSLAAQEDVVAFVSYTPSRPSITDVLRLDLQTGTTELVATIDGSGSTADVDMDSDGRIYIVSDTQRTVVDADGVILEASEERTANPQVAVNHRGDTVWIEAAGWAPVPYRVEGGSEAARALIKNDGACKDEHLSLVQERKRYDLDALCPATGIAWFGERHLVVSVGSEDGAPFIMVTPPS